MDVSNVAVATTDGLVDFSAFNFNLGYPASPIAELLADRAGFAERETANKPARQARSAMSSTGVIQSIHQPTPTQSRHSATGGVAKLAENVKLTRSGIKYVPQSALDKELAGLEQLSQSVLEGDQGALDTLRSALDNCPHIWRRLADLQHLIDRQLLKLIGAEDPLRREAFRKRWAEFRQHLLEEEPASLATKMAASRAVACWLFVQLLELRVLESLGDLRCLKAMVQAERRFQTAMRTLSMARQADLQMQRMRS